MHGITLGKLGERVLRILSSGKVTTELRVKQQDCNLAVAQARDSVLKDLITDKSRVDSNVMFDILSEVEITPVKERNYTTATLPYRALSLPFYSTGIHLVTHANDIVNEIIPTSTSRQTLFSGQDSRTMEGNAYYNVLGDELRLYQFNGECDILVQYVRVGESFTEDEDFKIPSSIQDLVVKMAVETLMVQEGEEDAFTDAKNP